jgi:PAS domain S-box-containing protein
MEEKNYFCAKEHLINMSDEGLWHTDQYGVSRFLNDSFYQQFSMTSDSNSFENWLSLIHPEDRSKARDSVNNAYDEPLEKYIKSCYRVKNKSGQYLWIESKSKKIKLENNYFFVGIHRNISEQLLINQYLTHISKHDGETGFFNRQQFFNDIKNFNSEDLIITCCLTQLYSFQRKVGDEALSYMSSFLVSTLDDVLDSQYGIYRISSDVFVITLHRNYCENEVFFLMADIEKTFNKNSGLSNILSTKRLGLGALRVKDIQEKNPLIKVFNISEYSRLVSSPTLYFGEPKLTIDRYFEVQDSLDLAITNGEIYVELQPIVHTKSGDISSFEALARWYHPKLGKIPPSEFIPIAERLGLIHELGLRVFSEACKFLSCISSPGQCPTLVNVNISAHQLIISGFIEDVIGISKCFSILPEHIVLEITESHLLDDSPNIIKTLYKLHNYGFKLSIDDFGAGMSAITSLFRLPLYQVKLDKELVYEALKVEACLQLICYIRDYSEENDISLVVEGIEDNLMFEKMLAINIPFMQGYYLYPPQLPEYWID